jgi:hypothetical protein
MPCRKLHIPVLRRRLLRLITLHYQHNKIGVCFIKQVPMYISQERHFIIQILRKELMALKKAGDHGEQALTYLTR